MIIELKSGVIIGIKINTNDAGKLFRLTIQTANKTEDWFASNYYELNQALYKITELMESKG